MYWGVPPVRYDEVFEAATHIMSPPPMTLALEGDKVVEWSDAMESERQSVWEKDVFGEVDRHVWKKAIGTECALRVKTDSGGGS